MSEYYKSRRLSDIEVEFLITAVCADQRGETPTTRQVKRKKIEDTITRFSAHKFCLSANSSVLEHDIEAGATVVKVELDDVQLVPVADAMFAAIYDVPGATKHLNQSDRLRLALLANKYDVPKVLTATVQKLSSETLSPETLQLFWQLDGCWQQPFWPLLSQVIENKLSSNDSNKLQAVVDLLLYVCDRDLESVYTNPHDMRQQIILDLPRDVLVAFLASPELRVLSEDTILYTVAACTCFYEGWKPSAARPRSQLQQEFRDLLSVVRLPHLTLAVLCTYLPKMRWYSAEDVQHATFLHHRTSSTDALDMWEIPASWRLGPRPASLKTSHVCEYSCDVSSVAEAFDQVTQDGDEQELNEKDCGTFGGRSWMLEVVLSKVLEKGVRMQLFIGPALPAAAPIDLPWCFQGVSFHANNTVPGSNTFERRNIPSQGNHSIPVCMFGPVTSFQELLARLQPWIVDDVITFKVTVQSSSCL